ncbi:flagellar protein FlaG [Clostridium bornimense]|uniref:flagellar protein FlaG n=1 Tax=Clostridium bornimense TaxID=1216932 RepID=UPI001C107725|nr:flagellar protein FlaG [Clostridium bornimense]MBU5314805.1 flagellar protein FlaG [Clostridium bornimense]
MDVNIIHQGEQVTLELSGSTYEVSLYKENKGNNTEAELTLSRNDAKKVVEELNKYIDEKDTYAEYKVHDELGSVMIKIHDKETDEVIVEYPPEKILDMVAKMCERAGIFMDKKV